ncbi:MAG TPA: DNA polymerase ligase N-terminal domain-containing protein [Planctomycetaceae bacterium]|nr:DNA polymerase ligase N-terminal domain-containing protein [Planctomycetaceae bacterium]
MTAQSVAFVILEHDHPFIHWDFMFEEGDSLRSWRLLQEPIFEQWIDAEPLPRHRKHYLDYEGPVSGNRGQVTRWDFGTCQVNELQEEKISLILNGSRLSAKVTLERTSPDSERWKVWISPIEQIV